MASQMAEQSDVAEYKMIQRKEVSLPSPVGFPSICLKRSRAVSTIPECP